MPTPRPIHFEIHALDTDRAKKFYSTVFGWTFQDYKGDGFDYILVMTGDKTTPGINGGMLKRPVARAPIDDACINAYVITMDVDNIDTYIAKIEANGGTVAMPKTVMKGVGTMAYYKDTEGNVFGMMQPENPGQQPM